ncbi:MAG: tRNA (5-methylaminomethyl-2-thiouridylate)-methyltransferase [Pseudomonadota bacterium]
MRVLVAMSGGVDSSVCAARLVAQGHDVVGVHMKLHDADAQGRAGKCCGLDDAADAAQVADRLGIPFYVHDLRTAFREAVQQPFLDAWIGGRTPSPCIACNGVLKFRVLLQRALALGCSHLATGHYARIDGDRLLTARDPNKDQTYFLFPLTPRAVARTLFPLGDLTKDEVREEARRFGLLTAEKAESQDVCFLPDGDHGGWVAAQRPDLDASGTFVLQDGTVVGHHDGYHRFTVGQRKGLGVALGVPAFVVRVEPSTRRVVLGTDADLRHTGLEASGVHWLQPPEDGERIEVRVRHRGERIGAWVEAHGDGVRVRFDGHLRAVTPGQAAVFYRDEQVLGGAWIDRALRGAA